MQLHYYNIVLFIKFPGKIVAITIKHTALTTTSEWTTTNLNTQKQRQNGQQQTNKLKHNNKLKHTGKQLDFDYTNTTMLGKETAITTILKHR